MPNEQDNDSSDSVNQVTETTPQSASVPLADSTSSVEREPQTSEIFGAAISEPVAPFTPLQVSPQGTKSSKKKWLIGGSIAAALLVILTSAGVAYAFYQNPEKVLIDGVVNTFSSRAGSGKATLDYKSKMGKLTLVVDVKGDDELVNGKLSLNADIPEYSLKLDATADFAATLSGDGYIKINDLKKIITTTVDAMVTAQAKEYKQSGTSLTPQQIAEIKKQTLDSFEPYIRKIDNKWIKFPSNQSDEASKIQKCYSDTFKKLQSDKAMKDELTNVYEKNKFVVIKKELGVKDGSYGFVIDLDTKKSKSFGKQAEKTKFAKAMDKCNTSKNEDYEPTAPSDTSSDSEKDALKDTTIEVWVSQWSHQITAVNVNVDRKKEEDQAVVKFALTLDYAKPTDVTVPKDSTNFEDVQKEISKELESQPTNQSQSSFLSTSVLDSVTTPNSLF